VTALPAAFGPPADIQEAEAVMRTGTRPADGRLAAVWQVDLTVAVILAIVGVVVMLDSLRIGNGWAPDGPQAGFFPFYVGLLLTGGAGVTVLTNLLPLRRDFDVFVEAAAFRRVLAVLLPTVAYVIGVELLGIYVSSALLIALFMRLFGQYGYAAGLGLGIAVSIVLFACFELWFLVPLPKGALEAALGF
jgi:hypothetical protein